MLRTIKLVIAYDGTGFRGWARQRDPAVRTVEGVLTSLLEQVVGEPVRLSVAGRTDAGVHARGQVVSFVTTSRVHPERLRRFVLDRLAPEVVIVDAAYAADGFDARRSATGREYTYRLDVGPSPDPFTGRFTWHRPRDLSLAAMRAAAHNLVGRHDFSSFCRRAGDDVSTVRDLQRLSIARSGDIFVFRLRANAFLHQMVRSIVGTLVAVGEGRIEPDAMPAILAARDRAAAGPVAPPRGLTLERVIYGRRP